MRILLCAMIVAMPLASATAQPQYPKAAADAHLVFDDLAHFIEAFDALEHASDSVAVIDGLYIERGSPGLKEYQSRHGLTAQMIVDAIATDPESYRALRDFHAGRDGFARRFGTVMHRFATVIGSPVYPPTYLLVGANRGIAQASATGQLVTIERSLPDQAKLMKFIVHELAHFQQVMAMGFEAYGGLFSQEDNMLGLCLREGVAEFVTHRVLGEITQTAALSYLVDNEQAMWRQYQYDLQTQDASLWLWDTVGRKDVPQLLGYAIGFRIVASYYDNAADKESAMRSILGLTEAEAFLEMSGYNP